MVCVFKQLFSVFKQHFTHFYTFFHPHIFSISTNIFKQQFLVFKHVYQTSPKSFRGVLWDQGQTQVGAKGAWAPLGPIYLFIIIIYFIFVVGPPSKTLGPFFSINQASLTQIITNQPKNLTKTIKTFTMVIVV